jgi:PAS domain S-box-containing protein
VPETWALDSAEPGSDPGGNQVIAPNRPRPPWSASPGAWEDPVRYTISLPFPKNNAEVDLPVTVVRSDGLESDTPPALRPVSSYRSSGHSCPPVRSVAAARIQKGVQGVRKARVWCLSDELEIESAPPGIILETPFENVSERKNNQQALHEGEEFLRLLIENIREYAVFQLDPRGHIVSWNAGAQRLKGYRAEEVLGKYISLFYDPNEARSGKAEYNLAKAVRVGECKDEGWRVRKDGSRFWASVLITAVKDSSGNLGGFLTITRDTTDRRAREAILKEAKETLDLRALAARLQLVREEERTLVAREMHDELGQACTAIKMDLAAIGRKATKRQTQIRVKVDSALKLVDKMIFTVRRIASDLRPKTLDDLGLTAALEGQAQEFESRTGIRCIVVLPREQLALDSEHSTAMFRIFQESLTNVAR